MSETLIEREDGLVRITFNRPERRNALNAASWAALDQTLREVALSPDDRALVLRGAGGNFSAGADLSGGMPAKDSERKGSLTGGPPQAILHEMRAVGEIISRLQRLPKPTLAVVDGDAIGVALGLVLACDLVIASERARFCEIFPKRGLALDGGTSWSLPRIVGLRRAKQLAFFGDHLSAQDALAFGLVNEVVPNEKLDETAARWSRRLASGPTTALSLIKRMLDASDTRSFEQAVEDEARAQHIVFTTSDMHEGIRAFVERREPRFTGK